MVCSYPQSRPTGIGNTTGRSTPAARYSASRAVSRSALPCATNPSATGCGTFSAAPARSPASVSSRTPLRSPNAPNSRGTAGCST